jgi:hypothetical protein
MKLNVFRGCCLVGLWLLLVSAQAVAASFDERTINLGHPANGDIIKLADGHHLVVAGHSIRDRWLSVVDIRTHQPRLLSLAPDMQFFAPGVLAGRSEPSLLFLGARGVHAYHPDSSEWAKIVPALSLYRGQDPKRVLLHDFSRDITGNGLSDLLLPDFEHYHLYLQQDDGSFRHFQLEMPAQMRTLERTTSFLPRRAHLLDVDMSGRLDLVFFVDGQMWVFHQAEDHSFTSSPDLYPLQVTLSPDLDVDVRPGDGLDYSGLELRRVLRLEDLNGNGIPDLVVRKQVYQDALDQAQSYLIYYGRVSEGGLRFPAEADARIDTEGFQFEPLFVDANGDGRIDFVTASTRLGLGAIVRALLTGAATTEVRVHLQRSDGSFSSEPDYQQSARVEVNIRGATAHMPVVTLADLNGDGRAALLVSQGRDTLLRYPADGNGLFARRAERSSIVLPRDADRILVLDLDGNGRQDLVLPFGPLDEPEMRGKLKLLYSK